MGDSYGFRMPREVYQPEGLRMPKEGYQPEGLRMTSGNSLKEMGGGTGLQVPQNFSVDSGLTGAGGGGFNAGVNTMNPAYMYAANTLIRQSQPQQQAPEQVVQNTIPQGRNVTYQDVMKMYGIKGLMG